MIIYIVHKSCLFFVLFALRLDMLTKKLSLVTIVENRVVSIRNSKINFYLRKYFLEKSVYYKLKSTTLYYLNK